MSLWYIKLFEEAREYIAEFLEEQADRCKIRNVFKGVSSLGVMSSNIQTILTERMDKEIISREDFDKEVGKIDDYNFQIYTKLKEIIEEKCGFKQKK